MKEVNHTRTLLACFGAMFNQAISINLVPLLIVPFISLYGLTISDFGILIGVNFLMQMLTDMVLTVRMEKLVYKNMIALANILSFIGMYILLFSPNFGSDPFIFMIIGIILTSIGSGILEVTVAPVVDTIPNDYKAKKTSMTLAHGFYAWGQLATVLIVTLFLIFVGDKYWQIVVAFLSIFYILDIILISRTSIEQTRNSANIKKDRKVLRSPIFILLALAITFGSGAELIMNQYISVFCEVTLNLPKSYANLIGMGLFAVSMGIGRTWYGVFGMKFDLCKIIIVSGFACFGLYLLAGLTTIPVLAMVSGVFVGLFTSLCWPGALTIAGMKFPKCGAWIFSFLSILGDLGGGVFPTSAGLIGDYFGLKIMMIISSIFPLLCAICYILINRLSKNSKFLPNP